MTLSRNPPFFAWITVPCGLDADVWTVKPSDCRWLTIFAYAMSAADPSRAPLLAL
jgi:hypothetical protein